MIARKHILEKNSYAHVNFRCHNKQFLLVDKDVKIFLLRLWAKYLKKYELKLFEFNIMDNHCHCLIQTSSVENLSNFMRTVNSQIARYVNKKYARDSQVIRERFNSPLITSDKYLVNTMKYILLNRYKINKKRPEQDPFCSAFWRINTDFARSLGRNKTEQKDLENMLTSYSELPINGHKSEKIFAIDLINDAISRCSDFVDIVFMNTHTIGDDLAIKFRSQLISSMRRPP